MIGLRLLCAFLLLLPIACSRTPDTARPAAVPDEVEVLPDDPPIRPEPETADDYVARGDDEAEQGDYLKAIADYQEALRLDPQHAEAHDSLAWLLATCPQDGVRNGPRALDLAMKVCELSSWQDAYHLSTLAAAHAECGNFPEAVRWQKKAIEIGFNDGDDGETAHQHLKLYEKGRPCRDQ
jgi:tetratricopeptide (TPR) repeat protein